MDRASVEQASSLPTVLLVDDDKIVHQIVRKAIVGHYQSVDAFDSDQAISALETLLPSVILLDIEMPGRNGYETCELLRQDRRFDFVPIVILSGRNSLRERMLAIESGADDFLVKPCSPEDLLTALSAASKSSRQKKLLEEKRRDAEKTAFIAMNGMSEIGAAMQFAERTYQLNDIHDLIALMIATLDGMRLKAVVAFVHGDSYVWAGHNDQTSSLEQQLVINLRERGGRIFDFGCRTQFNCTCASLLIKNMPLDDPEKYGRLKDILLVMLGAVDVKIQAINLDRAILEQANQLRGSFDLIRQTLVVLGDSLAENHENGGNVMRTMVEQLALDLPRMGLEDDQERFILSTIDKAIVESAGIMDNGARISQSFQEVLSKMQLLVEQQNQLVGQIYSTKNTHVDVAVPAGDGIGDVELF